MSGSEVVHYDLPPLLVDTASPTTSGRVHARRHEIQALRAVETHVLCPVDPRYHREPQVRKSGVMDGGVVRSSVLGGELW